MTKYFTTISFKDPDLIRHLRDAGMPAKGVKRIMDKADCGEYFEIELSFSENGALLGAKLNNI